MIFAGDHIKTPHTVPSTAREMSHTEPPTEALFFHLPQVETYWRDMAGAYRDMAPEGFRELLLSLPPHPRLPRRHRPQGHGESPFFPPLQQDQQMS